MNRKQARRYRYCFINAYLAARLGDIRGTIDYWLKLIEEKIDARPIFLTDQVFETINYSAMSPMDRAEWLLEQTLELHERVVNDQIFY